jgi:4,5-DOPA dioxygenase extradiol
MGESGAAAKQKTGSGPLNGPGRTPALFVGHGSPMNALADNAHTRALRAWGSGLPRPRAVLSVSAHWYTRGTGVTAMPSPRTIHDFGGFPQALFDIQYPAPGDPALAQHVRQLLQPVAVIEDHAWGMDHGTWQVLVHLFPDASIPVVQLSIDAAQPAAFHYELGRKLASLRAEGVLIMGSGNVVHNLRTIVREDEAPVQDWAMRFGTHVRQALARRDHAALIDYTAFGADARMSVPSPDHYLPLLYVLGTQAAEDEVSTVADGFQYGSLDMLSFAV